ASTRTRLALPAADSGTLGPAVGDLTDPVHPARHLAERDDHGLLERRRLGPLVELDGELLAHGELGKVLETDLETRIRARALDVAADALPGDDAGGRRHLVVGLQPFLDADGETARRIEVIAREDDEVAADAGPAARLRGRRRALHDQLGHVQAERVLRIAVVRIAAVPDPVPVDVRLVGVGHRRAVVLAVDDAVTIGVDAAGARGTRSALAGARAAASRRGTTGGAVRLPLAIGRAAIAGDVGARVTLLPRIDVAVATL